MTWMELSWVTVIHFVCLSWLDGNRWTLNTEYQNLFDRAIYFGWIFIEVHMTFYFLQFEWNDFISASFSIRWIYHNPECVCTANYQFMNWNHNNATADWLRIENYPTNACVITCSALRVADEFTLKRRRASSGNPSSSCYALRLHLLPLSIIQ